MLIENEPSRHSKICQECEKLTGEIVMMNRKTIDFPDEDTTDYLVDYFICPRHADHFISIPGTGRYSPLL